MQKKHPNELHENMLLSDLDNVSEVHSLPSTHRSPSPVPPTPLHSPHPPPTPVQSSPTSSHRTPSLGLSFVYSDIDLSLWLGADSGVEHGPTQANTGEEVSPVTILRHEIDGSEYNVFVAFSNPDH